MLLLVAYISSLDNIYTWNLPFVVNICFSLRKGMMVNICLIQMYPKILDKLRQRKVIHVMLISINGNRFIRCYFLCMHAIIVKIYLQRSLFFPNC